jgi:hypothetical protein
VESIWNHIGAEKSGAPPRRYYRLRHRGAPEDPAPSQPPAPTNGEVDASSIDFEGHAGRGSLAIGHSRMSAASGPAIRLALMLVSHVYLKLQMTLHRKMESLTALSRIAGGFRYESFYSPLLRPEILVGRTGRG